MPVIENIGRRQSIPIIYTRGTHYEVGFDVGRTFGSLIHSFLDSCATLRDEYIPAFETPEGKQAYDDTLNNLKKNFPQYIQELEGTADGAKVPFYKLFLLHMDDIILAPGQKRTATGTGKQPTGCSTIMVNCKNQQIIGHTEDALSDTLNHFYFVSAHIISDKPQGRWNVTEEKFTSLCYAGHLPGYTMNYNHHGLVFSINTISAKCLQPGKTPRHFLTRALLSAENYPQAKRILEDVGSGAADGCSVNLTFLNQPGDRVFHNIEMAPAVNTNESQLNFLAFNPGGHSIHCNEYIRLQREQSNVPMIESSKARFETFNKFKTPTSKQDVIVMLGDTSHPKYNVFRDNDVVTTIAVGIFDCVDKTWNIYSDNPKTTEPLVTLPLVLKTNKN